MTRYSYDTRYAFITGAIRAIEAKMITSELIDHLKRADSLKSAMQLLKNTVYNDFFQEHGDTDDFNKMLNF